jgi:hypothetical protein
MPSKIPVYPLRLEPALKARAEAIVAQYPGRSLNEWFQLLVRDGCERWEAHLNAERLRDGKAMLPAKVVDGPKVSRNGPCSCGSGRKYKRCCGR